MAPQLPTRKLGKNGPEVTALGFGLMGLSAFYGKPKPDEERFAMLDHVYDSGERFWDSADMYNDSEDLIGNWFKKNPGKRETIFLATKFGNWVDPKTGERSVRNEPEYVKQACEKSLKRLGVDQIDLYYVHRLNASQPVEVTIKAMKELQDAGKVKYLGMSECSADSLRRACKVGMSKPTGIYSLNPFVRWCTSMPSRLNIALSRWTLKARRLISSGLVESSALPPLHIHH